jgi:hypothetical protein
VITYTTLWGFAVFCCLSIVFNHLTGPRPNPNTAEHIITVLVFSAALTLFNWFLGSILRWLV